MPDWGSPSPFDGEEASDIVASTFSAPADAVEVERWNGPLVTLSAVNEAAAFLRVNGMSSAAAHAAASALTLPLTLTMRGCVVYARNASSSAQ